MIFYSKYSMFIDVLKDSKSMGEIKKHTINFVKKDYENVSVNHLIDNKVK